MEFKELVKEHGIYLSQREDSSTIQSLVHKLKDLKYVVIQTKKVKKRKLKEDLLNIEGEIHGIYLNNIYGILLGPERDLVFSLERRRMSILKIQEDS